MKTSYQKVINVFFSLLIIFGTFSSSITVPRKVDAAEQMHVEMTFDQSATENRDTQLYNEGASITLKGDIGGNWGGYKTDENNYFKLEQAPGREDYSLKFVNQSSDTNIARNNLNNREGVTGDLVYQFSVYPKDTNAERIFQLRSFDTETSDAFYLDLITLDDAGKVLSADNETLVDYEAENWYNFKVMIDSQENLLTYFVNDEQVGEAALPENWVNVYNLRIVQKPSSNGGVVEMYVDDIQLSDQEEIGSPETPEDNIFKKHSVITFEKGEDVPSEILAHEESVLSINEDQYQDQGASLEWRFNGGNDLTITHPIGYENDKDNFTFGIWIYNNEPMDEPLLFEFKEGDEIRTSFEFNMNFEGWRTAWVPFSDMEGEPSTAMDQLTITAPENHDGSILLDQIVLSVPMDIRYPTRDAQVPFVNLEADSRPNAHWLSLYLFDTWLSNHLNEADITEADLVGIESIADRYKKFIIGNDFEVTLEDVTAEDMEEYRTEFNNYEIERLGDGSITGRPVNLEHIVDIYPPNIREEMKAKTNTINVRSYTDFLLVIAKAFMATDDLIYKEELEMMYIDMIEHMLDQGWESGSSLGTIHHLGYNMRGYYPSAFLMKDSLKEAGLLERTQESMKWFTGIGRLYEPLAKPGEKTYANIDILNTTLQGMIAVLLTIDDEKEQVALFNQLSNWLSDGLMPAPGLMPSLKVDGSGFHHMGFYPAYARGAYNSMSPVVYFLNQTPFSISEESHETLKKAVMAMRHYSNKYEWLLSVSGRHPTGKEKLTSHAYRYLALAGSPDGTEEIDPEIAAAYLRLVEADRVDGLTNYIRNLGYTAEADPSGNWTMNYGALSLHRKDNWLVGVKGHNRYVWAGELYTNANWYGRYTSYGQIEIMSHGNEGNTTSESNIINNEDSGYKHEGWNWNRWPGTTAITLPFDELKAKSFTEMLLTDETFAGGLNIEGENGMFGMKLHEHPKYNDSHRARKSVFMFDERIIALGSNIENDDTEHHTETTLFQNYMKDEDESITGKDGAVIESFPYADDFETDDNTFLLDNKGHGYYVPKGQKVHISRSLQHSKDQKNGRDTEGNFSTAWIDHGKAPENESYEYAIMINAGDKNADKWAAFQEGIATDLPFYTVLKKDRDAHIVYDQGSQTTGYALFEEDVSIDTGHINSTDTPVMVMIKEKAEDHLVLSTVDPDLRLYEGRDEEQYDDEGNFIGQGPYSRPWIENESIEHSSQISIKGHWNLDSDGDNYRVIAHTDDGNTILEFDNKDAMPIEVELLASKPSDNNDEDGKDGEDGEDGKDGEDGEDGKDGEDGEDGKDGEDGEDGKDGEDGENGKDGEDGENGKDGKDGENGKDGEDGEDGKDGKPNNESQPESGVKPDDNDKPGQNSDEGEKLPKTATSIFNFLWIGLTLVFVGLLSYLYKAYRTRIRNN